MAGLGTSIRYAKSSAVTPEFFGTVVKSGESIDPNTGLLKSGGSTNYGQQLVGNTPTTQAMALLHLGSIRYLGGGENRLFDISDKTDLDGLKRAIDYCSLNQLSLNFTLNDAKYINPFTQTATITTAQRAELLRFIQVDLMGYAIAKGVQIESIHLGNEFAGDTQIHGPKAYIGYGKVSALLLHELDAALDGVRFSAVSNRPTLVIEPPNWDNRHQQATFLDLLKSSIGADGQSAASKIYAVDLHGAGSGGPTATNTLELTWDKYYGTSSGFDYETNFRNVMAYWANDSAMQHVHFRNSAWAYAETPMLRDAALGMLQLHSASKLGLISVTNYVGYNLDNSALIYSGNGQILLRAGGALFAMMSQSLRGTEAIGLTTTPSLQMESTAPNQIRAFAGCDHLVLYNVNRTAADLAVDLDAAALFASLEIFIGGVKSADVDILGSSDPNHKNGIVTHELISLTMPKLASGAADFTLDAYEIAQVTILANGMFGDSEQNTITGSAGKDVLHGLGGDDIIYAGNGADILTGGAGMDRLYGDASDDLLFGGAGSDFLYGGLGIDTASYAFADQAVIANLLNSSVNTGDAAGDIYVLIENLSCSNFNDQLTGNALANLLNGGAGDDTFFFSGGADSFAGGLGTGDAIQIDAAATRLSLFDGSNSRGISFSEIEKFLAASAMTV